MDFLNFQAISSEYSVNISDCKDQRMLVWYSTSIPMVQGGLPCIIIPVVGPLKLPKCFKS